MRQKVGVQPVTTARPAMPSTPLWLGLGGLIPFYAALALVYTAPGEIAAVALRGLIGYGAVILSFLGGVWWGAGLRSSDVGDRHMVLSVLPSLVAWPALYLSPQNALLVLLAGHVASGLVDRIAALSGNLPAWYGRLRVILAIGASLALALALLRPSILEA